MKLSDLAPGDVACFVRADGDGDQFVVLNNHEPYEATLIHKVTDNSPYWADWHGKTVRRLGRGRLIPARIALNGEPAVAAFRSVPPLAWTDAKPTAPGWYWWRRIDARDDARCVLVDVVDGELKVRIASFWQSLFGQFAGPIPVPAERGEGRG